MNPRTRFLFRFVIALVTFALLVLASVGCEEENPLDADTAELQEADIFPISVGHVFVFTAYGLDTTNSQQIPGSVHRDVSYVQGTTIIEGKTAFRMIDSTYSPSGEFEELDTTYIAIENGNLLILNGEGTQNTWITFFDKSAGFNTEYTAGQFQVQDGGVTATATFKGKIYPKETITVPIGTVEAYKAELKIILTFGTESYEWIEQNIYFAAGYGPVKMTTPVSTQPGTNFKFEGEETLMVSKNF